MTQEIVWISGAQPEHWTEFPGDREIAVGKGRLGKDGIFTLITRKSMLHGAVGRLLTLCRGKILVPAFLEWKLTSQLKDSLRYQVPLISRTHLQAHA